MPDPPDQVLERGGGGVCIAANTRSSGGDDHRAPARCRSFVATVFAADLRGNPAYCGRRSARATSTCAAAARHTHGSLAARACGIWPGLHAADARPAAEHARHNTAL